MMADPDFGVELSCTNDIANDSRTVTGFTVVAEAIVRRWITPRGRLIGYPNYGFDITQFINADMTSSEISAMIAGMQAEALKDERVASCTVLGTLGSDGVFTFDAEVETSQGPFTFSISASDVSVKLLEVT